MIIVNYDNDVKDFRKITYYTSFVKNGGMYPPILMASMAVVSLILGLGGLRGGLIISLVFLATGLAMFLFRFFRIKMSADDVLKRAKDFPKVKNVYSFDESTFEVETSVGKKKDKKTLLYTQLWEIKETKKFFLLFVDNNMCFILKKKNASEEEIKALSEKFKGIEAKLKTKRKSARRNKKSVKNDSFLGRK